METIDYMNGIVYQNGHIDYILTTEGRLKVSEYDTEFTPEYFIKDHLGNVRAVVSPDSNARFPLQYNDYYPFGLEFFNGGSFDNQIKYNSKELQTEADLNWYDYGARMYDPVLARWHVVDPMAESSRRWSPYAYCMDNPIRFIDPDGMRVDWYQNSSGSSVIWQPGNAPNVNINGESYTNIGTTYSQNIGNDASVTYTQNVATSITYANMDQSQWVSQLNADGTPRLKEDGTKVQCYDASVEMLQNAGVTTAGRGSEILVANANADGTASGASANSQNGLAVINNTIENGQPLIVGVDYKAGSPNADRMTDHFVVIAGKTETIQNGAVTSTSYNFYDPGRTNRTAGASNNNRLRLGGNGLLQGSITVNGRQKTYQTTTVRRNR